MDHLVKTITFEKAHAEVSKFDNETEVREYHVMLHVDDATLNYSEQLEAILNAYNSFV